MDNLLFLSKFVDDLLRMFFLLQFTAYVERIKKREAIFISPTLGPAQLAAARSTVRPRGADDSKTDTPPFPTPTRSPNPTGPEIRVRRRRL